MCSINEEAVPEPRNRLQAEGELKCAKCKRDVPIVITRVNDAFCQECFLVYAVHKFRSAIGKTKVIVPKDHVLVAYSGGPASSALLHFIQQGISEGKLRFTVSVVHIDELGLTALSGEERREKVDEVAQIVRQRGFPLFLTCLEEGMNVGGTEAPSGGGSPPLCREVTSQTDVGDILAKSDAGKLKDVLNALPSVSAKEEFIRVLRNQLLVEVARQRGFRKVVVADTATLLSIRIMTDMAKGKGAQVSFDTSIGDDRYGDVMIVRPLRDLNLKEVETYNKLQNIESVSIPHIQDQWHQGNSIEQLTTVFITGLQDGFPSTVPNIVRTSAKLGQEEESGDRGQCSMCQSPLDTDVGEASALRAVEVSERLAQGPATPVDEAAGVGTDRLRMEEVNPSLCYGCRLMVKGMKDASFLPPRVKSTALSRNEMRSQIAEYLLEDDCET